MIEVWFRRPGRKYHRARSDWVQSGRGVCGADIRTPAYVADTLAEAERGKVGVCKTCVRKGAA